MPSKFFVAFLITLSWVFSSPALAQDICDDSIAITGLELRLNAAKALHRGCMVRERILFDRDPEAYIEAYGTNFNACNNRFLSRINCNNQGEQFCTAIRDYETAVQQCRQAQNSENNIAKDSAEKLNERRREDGGANTLSKELTEDALERLNTETGSALNSFSDAANSVSENNSTSPSTSGGQVAPLAEKQFGLEAELSPEFQAILDVSVDALRQANRDNDLSIDEAQQILNNGLQQIEEQTQRDIDQARNEFFNDRSGSQTEDNLEAQMRGRFQEFAPPPSRQAMTANIDAAREASSRGVSIPVSSLDRFSACCLVAHRDRGYGRQASVQRCTEDASRHLSVARSQGSQSVIVSGTNRWCQLASAPPQLTRSPRVLSPQQSQSQGSRMRFCRDPDVTCAPNVSACLSRPECSFVIRWR